MKPPPDFATRNFGQHELHGSCKTSLFMRYEFLSEILTDFERLTLSPLLFIYTKKSLICGSQVVTDIALA